MINKTTAYKPVLVKYLFTVYFFQNNEISLKIVFLKKGTFVYKGTQKLSIMNVIICYLKCQDIFSNNFGM